MSTVFWAAAVILFAAAAQMVLQKYAPLFGLLFSVGAALVLLARLGTAVQTILQGVRLLAQRTDGQAFSCLLRCAGILLLTDYLRTLCEEAGADSLGWCTGFAGRCLVLAAAFPLLEEVCRKIGGLA